MQSSITFFSLVSGLLDSANVGINEAINLSEKQPTIFVAPKIDIQLKCTINKNDLLEVTPSNGIVTNLYGNLGESLLNLQFKIKPKGGKNE
jgi:hypothetical protein